MSTRKAPKMAPGMAKALMRADHPTDWMRVCSLPKPDTSVGAKRLNE
jgi:hypothetical protein